MSDNSETTGLLGRCALNETPPSGGKVTPPPVLPEGVRRRLVDLERAEENNRRRSV